MNSTTPVGLLLITHGDIGTALIQNARDIFELEQLNIDLVEVPIGCNEELVKAKIQHALKEVNKGKGVLILNDIYGATPFNIAYSLLNDAKDIEILSGINLSMLLRTITYRHLPLDELKEKAREGGVNGVRYADKLAEGPE